jgi:DNA mismatch repair protein MSH2
VTVFRNLLRDALFRLGKRVEIWESTGSKGQWKCTKQASPGNLQDVEDELGGNVEAAPIILAVKVSAKASEARNVGVCFADASVRELGVSEFLDNDLYSNFESLLIQLGVKEILVVAEGQKKDIELAKLKSIADACGIAVAERPVPDFGTRDIEQDLSRLLKGEITAGTLPQTDLKLAMGSAAALIRYLGVMSDGSNFGQYQLYQHDLSQYMKLDAAALKALNLMPGPRDGSKNMSLYGLLNHCKTPVGSRLLAQWLKQPLMNLEEIEKRQQLVESFVVDTELRQTMQEEHLRSIPDLYRLSKRFQRKQANLEDVVRAYQVVIRLPGFIGTLEGVIDEQYQVPLEAEYTSKLRDQFENLAKLQEMVETTVDLDALDNHEFIIKPEYDDNLRTIRKKLDKLWYDMDVEHTKVGKDLGQDTEKKLFLENHRVHGWCFRLTRTVRHLNPLMSISNIATGSWVHSQQERIPGMFYPKEWRLLHNLPSLLSPPRTRSTLLKLQPHSILSSDRSCPSRSVVHSRPRIPCRPPRSPRCHRLICPRLRSRPNSLRPPQDASSWRGRHNFERGSTPLHGNARRHLLHHKRRPPHPRRILLPHHHRP